MPSALAQVLNMRYCCAVRDMTEGQPTRTRAGPETQAPAESHTSRRLGIPRSTVFWSCIFLGYFLVVVMLQSLTGTYRSELSHYPDEPAHVVTSLMIRDYLVSGFHQSPVAFAQNYYLHYPKVAFGWWPPFFHCSAAVWMLIFPPTRTWLLLFMALQTAALALILALFAARLFGRAAILLGAGLLCLPIIQWDASVVMVDICVAVLGLLAMWSAVRYFTTQRRWWAVLFGALTALAMMTKGTGTALILAPVFLLLLTRRFFLLRKPDLYIAAAIVVIAGLPWQFLTWRLSMARGSFFGPITRISRDVGIAPQAAAFVRYAWATFATYAAWFVSEFGIVLSVFALAAAAVEVLAIIRTRSSELNGDEISRAGVVSLFAAVVIFQSIAPTPPEGRYMTPAVPLFLLLMASGIRRLAGTGFRGVGFTIRAGVLALAAAALFGATKFAIPSAPPEGFAEVASKLIRPGPNTEAILVCSDANGEGALITEVALRDQRPRAVVIRATKVISENPWSNGGQYRPLLRTPEEAEQYLDSVPVDTIVIDASAVLWPQDRQLLFDTTREYPAIWRPYLESPGDVTGRHLVVYRRAGADSDTRPKRLRLHIPLGLGRDEIELNPR